MAKKETSNLPEEKQAILDAAIANRDNLVEEHGAHSFLAKDASRYVEQLKTKFAGGEV